MASKLDVLKVKPIAKTKREFDVIIREKPKDKPQTKRPLITEFEKPETLILPEMRGENEPKDVSIVQPPQMTTKQTTIIDKRSERLINRDDFLKKLKTTIDVGPGPVLTTVQEDITPTETVLEQSTQSGPTLILSPKPIIIKPPERSVTKIKKIKIKRPVPPTEGTVIEDVNIPEYLAEKDLPEEKKVKKIRIRRKIGIKGDLTVNVFNDKNLPKRGKRVLLKTSEYYLSNRQIFVDFINNLFSKYGEPTTNEVDKLTCKKLESAQESDEFQLLNHQKLVRDYMNMFTPYRGILLFHGLGSGKTCSSIAIAEGMKDDKEVIVMTPASLRRNYIEEMKSCGDPLIRRNSHWVFLLFSDEDIKNIYDSSVVEEGASPNKIRHYSKLLSLSPEFLIKQGGVWLANASKSPNYDILNKEQRVSLENQINAMISNKYTFINYNGLRESHLKKMTNDGTINPFDNKVVIVDEVHNLVSRIVNKLNRPSSINMQLYHLLCSAERCRLVFLSGTPIINYPNELGILFNMLRGYIKTFNMILDIKTTAKVSQDTLHKMLLSNRDLGSLIDFIEYKSSTKTLVFSRNPYGFINSFTRTHDVKGIRLDEKGQIDDESLLVLLEDVLKNKNIGILKGSIKIELEKSIPDVLDVFNKYFINEKSGTMENKELFKRFVMGLVSYYRSDNEELMPEYNEDRDFIIEKIEMNDYQFKVYENARKSEREADRKKSKKKKLIKKDDLYEETASTYRIFSRLFCNFVFPESISRPLPTDDKDVNIDEDRVDAKTSAEIIENEEGTYAYDDENELLKDETKIKLSDYNTRIKDAIYELDSRKYELFNKDNLKTYSPKFLKILENIEDNNNIGSHLIYSQFRTLEGIGILKMVLEANGFTQFKITKNDVGNIVLDIAMEDIDKPKFVLYTGTEDPETKEIYRNVFNGNWKQVPSTLSQQLNELGDNNILGNIIKIFMITSSGAEGISLKNCRHVHIVEPYWHPVRIKQVIGRVRRICSHAELPEELQNIKVYMYLMTLSDSQKKSDDTLELRLRDVSRIDNKTPLTTDEALFEISNMKEEINKQLERAIKEASIDCMVYIKQNTKEGISCLSFGPIQDQRRLSRKINVADDEKDAVQMLNRATITMKAVEITLAGKKYAFVKREDANISVLERPDLVGLIYDYQSFLDARENTNINPRMVGELVKDESGSGYVFNAI